MRICRPPLMNMAKSGLIPTMSQQPLTDQQLTDFAANGFLHVPGLLPEPELIAPDHDSMALIERGSIAGSRIKVRRVPGNRLRNCWFCGA